MSVTKYKVRRPEGRKNFPLIEHFIYTGEPHNPWRCETCATKAQRAEATTTVPGEEVVRLNGGFPGCCRKCGTDFYR